MLALRLRLLSRFSRPAFSVNSTHPYIPTETKMHYKTIVLELLQQYPTLYNRLRSKRMLMPALELYARQLKTCHDGWTDTLSNVTPGRDQSHFEPAPNPERRLWTPIRLLARFI